MPVIGGSNPTVTVQVPVPVPAQTRPAKPKPAAPPPQPVPQGGVAPALPAPPAGFNVTPQARAFVLPWRPQVPQRKVAMARPRRMQRTHSDFLNHMNELPEDSNRSMVYADWLQDGGLDTHAEVVRGNAQQYEDNGQFGMYGGGPPLSEGKSWVRVNVHGYDSWRRGTMPSAYTVQLHVNTGAGPHASTSFAVTHADPREAKRVVDGLLKEGAVMGDERPWGYHLLTRHAAGETPQQMARKRDTDPRAREQEFRAFIDQIKNRPWRESPAGSAAGYVQDPVDTTAHRVFADWLREVTGNPADPRATVVERHADSPKWDDYPNGVYYYDVGTYGYWPRGVYATKHARGGGLGMTPVREGAQSRDWKDATHAIVEWQVALPPRRDSTGRAKPGRRAESHTFHARFNPEELHNLIDQLPEPHRAEWRKSATEYGLHDPRGAAKMSRPRRYSDVQPVTHGAAGHTHAEFLQAIRENPDSPMHVGVYADWLQDQGLEHTAAFVKKAGDDAARDKGWNHRFWNTTRGPAGMRGEDTSKVSRHVSVYPYAAETGMAHIELWQRSEDGNHALWAIHSIPLGEAEEWERRLRQEGAFVPMWKQIQERNAKKPRRRKSRLPQRRVTKL